MTALQGGQRGFGDALAATVAPHVAARCEASLATSAASSLLQTLLSGLEDCVAPAALLSGLRGVPLSLIHI